MIQISPEVTLEAVCKAFARAHRLQQVTSNVVRATTAGVVIESGARIVALSADTGNALNRRITMAAIASAARLEGKGRFVIMAGETVLCGMAGLRNTCLVMIGVSVTNLAEPLVGGYCLYEGGTGVTEGHVDTVDGRSDHEQVRRAMNIVATLAQTRRRRGILVQDVRRHRRCRRIVVTRSAQGIVVRQQEPRVIPESARYMGAVRVMTVGALGIQAMTGSGKVGLVRRCYSVRERRGRCCVADGTAQTRAHCPGRDGTRVATGTSRPRPGN